MIQLGFWCFLKLQLKPQWPFNFIIFFTLWEYFTFGDKNGAITTSLCCTCKAFRTNWRLVIILRSKIAALGLKEKKSLKECKHRSNSHLWITTSAIENVACNLKTPREIPENKNKNFKFYYSFKIAHLRRMLKLVWGWKLAIFSVLDLPKKQREWEKRLFKQLQQLTVSEANCCSQSKRNCPLTIKFYGPRTSKFHLKTFKSNLNFTTVAAKTKQHCKILTQELCQSVWETTWSNTILSKKHIS